MGNQHSSQSNSHSSNPISRRSRSSTVSSVQPDSVSPNAVIDFGFTEPQSHLYASAPPAYSRPVVHRLIQARRLAPYYLGLNDWEEDWDVPRLVEALIEGELQASKNLTDALAAASEAAAEAEAALLTIPPATRKSKEGQAALGQAVMHRERLHEMIRQRDKKGGGGLQWSSKAEQAKMYLATAEECPICFLYYPARTMHTRCCDQPICTECFVQIKRADATPTHLESEPAACPFCMEQNLGCVYVQPSPTRPTLQDTAHHSGSAFSNASDSSAPAPKAPEQPKPRRKSFAHTDPEVVTTDQLHPDWEAKLEAIKATVARRSNRRIVFRQIGDRLIPVGVTSGRAGDGANATMSTTQLPPGFMAQVAAAMDANNNAAGGSSSGRRAARRRNQEMAQYLEQMGIGVGQDLEEMMVMEAMRLSQLEADEAATKVKADEAAKARAGAGSGAGASPEAGPSNAPGTVVNTAALSDALAAPIGSSSPNPAEPSQPMDGTSSPAVGPASSSSPAGSLSSHVFSASDLDVLAAGRASLDGGARGAAGPEAAEPARANGQAAPLVDI